MASSTSPDGIVFPDASDPIAPLNAVFQDLAESVQTALDGVPSLNVDVTSPSYGQVISYDPASDNFTNNPDNNPVMVFDDATDRATAIPTPVAGMVTYLKDTDAVEKFDGTNFVPVIEADPPTISQVVQTVQTDVFSTVSATYTPITDFTATITPISTDSKVLIMAQFPLALFATVGGQRAVARLTGGNASTYIGDAGGSREQVVLRETGNVNTQQTVIFLDSPSTTSPLTYGVEVRGIGSPTPTLFVGSNGPDTDAADFTRAPRSITVMEVAG